VVITCSPKVRVLLSVSSTTVSIAPGPAMPGMASGWMARS
jgi:hypothetical protein